MKLNRLTFTLLRSAGVFLCLIACKSSTPVNLSTPTDALKTQVAALRANDVATYKMTLTKQTIQWLESESSRRNKAVDDLLKEFVEPKDEGVAWPSQTWEEKLNDNKVDVWYQSSGMWRFVRFAKEDGEWKMDGFGWPNKEVPPNLK